MGKNSDRRGQRLAHKTKTLSPKLAAVINGPGGPEIRLPLFPRKRTQVGHPAMSVWCQNRKSRSFDRPMREPSDWVVWCYNFDAIAAFPGRSAPKWRSADKRCVDLQLEARCQRSPKARLRMLI